MPIDKRKMNEISSSLSSRNLSLLLIFISLLWNVYNTYQYQILQERQLKLENLLAEISPSLSDTQLVRSSSSSSERWFTKVLHFIEQLTSTNNTPNHHQTESNKVRFVFLEMLSESLDTCI